MSRSNPRLHPDETGGASTPGARRYALEFVTRRPVAITMFMVAIAVFGMVSLGKLPIDLLPEISYPTLTVRTTYPGAAPEDVEDRVSTRIQEALNALPNLVRSTSVSRAGASDVVLDFDWGTDMTFAVQDARDRLDGVFLPADTERPLILRYDPNLDPILRIGVSAPARRDGAAAESGSSDLIHLRWLAEERIKRELESISGVAAIQVRGGLEEEIRVSVDPFKMAAQGLDPLALANRLAQENLNASGGQIREGSTDYLVRTLNEFRDIEEIRDLAIVRRGEGVIRVRDVAEVTRTHAEREVITRINGREAVEIAVYREAGANIVELAERVKNAVFGTEAQQRAAEEKAEGKDGPAGPGGPGASGRGSFSDRESTDFLAWRFRKDAELSVLSDQSTFIRAAVDDVKQAAVIGALLATLVMWFFLRRLAATVIVGLSIPISVVVTFAPMYLLDVSLNIMSLGGLALGVGMLVDNAIVVLESITRCREEGDDLARAAARGVHEVAGAITASTLTTVAVFAPIVFVHGIAGQIFGDQAVTVVSALLVSLLVAVLFIPMLASRPWLEGSALSPRKLARPPRFREGLNWTWGTFVPNLLVLVGRLALFVLGLALVALTLLVAGALGLFYIVIWPLRVAFDLSWKALARVYPPLLRGALAQPLLVVLAAGGLFYLAVQRVPRLGVELLPEIHQGEFTGRVALGIGTPVESTDEVLSGLDRTVRRMEGVALTAVTSGVEEDALTTDIEGEHTAKLTVRATPEHADVVNEERLLAAVRGELLDHPEVREVEIERPTPFALEAPIAVEVRGHDLFEIERVAEEIRVRLSELPELVDVRTSVRPGHPEAHIVFDRDKMLEFGLDLAAVSDLVRDQVLGNVSTRFVEGDERIDVRVLGDEDVLDTLDAVLELVVNPAAENPVPLSAVARVDVRRGPAEIRRIGNSRAVMVNAERAGLDLGGLTTKIEESLATLDLPDEVFVELGGQKREMDEASQSMRFALLLAVFLVYVVMASQFESLLQPLIILLSVPLAGVGVVFVLDLLGLPISVVVFIGLILLAGIVVNNAIVLVDRINAKRMEGLELREAVLEAGQARLRPILMTTATTVLGLLPLTGWLAGVPVVGALGSGEGAEIRAPMAITVVSGLLTSTVLTLVVIPVIYSLVARRAPRSLSAEVRP